VNDLPTATDNTVTATEDTAFVFAAVNFGFIDVDTADQLQSITVTTSESSTGTLALDGSAVTVVRSISSDDIVAGALTFTPLANAMVLAMTACNYTVNDGVADSLASATLTIDVTAVNDLPTATDNTVTATEDTAFVFAPVNFGFIDIDTTQMTPCRALQLPLCINRHARTQWHGGDLGGPEHISHDDILAGALTFTPLKDGNGHWLR
jgi:hypothetical protein